jgi:hypothetical protein
LEPTCCVCVAAANVQALRQGTRDCTGSKCASLAPGHA